MANEQLFGLLTPQTGQKVSRFGAALGGQLPQFDQQAEQRQARVSDERKRAFLLDSRSVLRSIRGGNLNGAKQLLQNRIQAVGELGGDPSQSMELLSLINQGKIAEVEQGLTSIDNRAVDEGIFKALPVAGGLEERKLTLAEERFALEQKQFKAEQDPAFKQPVVVKASEILPNGAVIQSTSEGVRVFNANGERLHGQDVADVIEAGQALGIRVAGDTAAVRAEADKVKQSIALSGKMFEKIGPLRQSLLTIGKARAAIAEGAETGVIDKLLPDIRESSIKLTNLMNQLGLEVVAGATFGALSAGELRLALDTALPTGLQPEALDRWLADKGAAQKTLLQELERDVLTLSNGGTIAGIIQARKAQSPAPATPQVTDVTKLSDDELRAMLGGQ